MRDGIPDKTREKALAELCETYWYPLYAFARRCGHAPHDAEDLTQGFFARLLERELFKKADPARGRLRSFLLGTFKNFMSEDWRVANCQKRGGGQWSIPIHELHSEELERGVAGFSPSADPEAIFDRVWFDLLLEQALNELQEEYRRRGKAEMFSRLRGFLAWNRKDARLAEVASDLGLSPGAVRVTILRMRQRFRELIERQVADTVGSAAEAADEMNHLRRVLGA
jgi:RNA polymerase sigma factor (sigma-70 family)